ncbi:MAG: lysylphosphatidylglycerol synthase transmembrane domain-containing protein [Minisyncoccia bacterium]
MIKKMRKSSFYILSLSLGLVLFIYSIGQAGIGSILKAISFFPVSSIIVIFLANFVAAIIISSWRWKIILESQDHCSVSFSKVLIAKLAGFTMGYITPSVFVGGEPIRVYMIKESTGCSWEKSLAAAIIDQAIYFFTLLLLMIIGFLFLADHFYLPRSITYGFTAIIIISFIFLHLFYSRVISKNPGREGFFIFLAKTLRLDNIKYIKKREENIKKTEKIVADFFRNRRNAFAKAFLLAVAEVIAYLVVVWIILAYLGSKATVFQSISIFAIITLASFVPIPGSLGSMEASLTFIFDLLNLGKGNGFTFSLIFRFVNIVVVIMGFLAIIYFEYKNIAGKFNQAPKELESIHKFLLGLIYGEK